MTALRTVLAVLCVASLAAPANAQMSLTSSGVAVTESFTGFTGAGFQSTPAAGQLDSDTWKVNGMSDGTMAFGNAKTTGDFARGATLSTTGGTFGVAVATSNPALVARPSGSDFNPGSFVLRLQNNTGATLTSLAVSYTIWCRNDGASGTTNNRSSSFNFSHSADDSAYTAIASLDFASPGLKDASPAWVSTPRSTTISGLSIANGSYYYLRWSSADISGSGGRDALGVDDVSVTGTAASCTVGAACDDSNPCTYGTTYDASCVCNGGTSYGCDDTKACTDDTCNGSGGCNNVIQSGKCLIGGACYSNNDTQPTNVCNKCTSATSTTFWSYNNGVACTTAGGGAGTCTSGTCVGADANSYVAVADAPIVGDFLVSDNTSNKTVAAFKVVDQGTSDGLTTTLTALMVSPGVDNTALWSTTLASAALYDAASGGTLVGTATSITDSAITFSGLAFVVPNGAARTLYLRITLATTPSLIDGDVLAFDNQSSVAGNSALAGGSTLAASGVAVVSSDIWIIDVMAVALFVTEEPTRVVPGMPFAISVAATDLNGNVDADYAEDVLIDVDPASGGAGTLTSVSFPDLIATAVAGEVTWPDLVYDTEDSFSLLATDGSGLIVDAQSSLFGAFINYDVSGFKLSNLQDGTSVTLAAGTVLAPGDYLIVGRDGTQAAFETFWGVTLAANVHYVSGKTLVGGTTNGWPLVNDTSTNSERFELRDASNTLLDGATPTALAFGQLDDCQRANIAGSGQTAGDWVCGLNAAVTETPGSGMTLTKSGKLVLSEFSDATTYNYEFVELFYDAEYQSICPNGTKEIGEACDDNANGNAADGCKDDCTFSCSANTDCADADPTDCVRPACVTGGNGKVCESGVGTAFEANGKLCDQGACDGAGTCAASNVGAIVVSEIMPNPAANGCDDAVGEWFELYNTRATPIDLNGWTVAYDNLAHNTPGSHTFTSPLVIGAHDYLLVCRTTPAAAGLPCDFQGLPFALGNSGGSLTLKDAGGATVDAATYQDNDQAGNAFTLSPCHLRADLNDTTASHWCYGGTVDAFACGTGSDHGTPGAANRPCAAENCFTCDNPATDCPNPVGDCKDAVCAPSGADWVCGTVNNDGDILDDGLACTADTCANGTAGHVSTAGLPCKTDAGLPANDGWCTAGGACNANTCGDTYKSSTEACDDGADGDPNDGCKDDCTFTCPTLGTACPDAILTDCHVPQCAVGGAGQLCEASPGTGLVAQNTACEGTGQCDASGNCALPALPGDVVVTEIGFNPDACDTAGSDAAGEWIELKNVSSHALNLVGWTLTDNQATATVATSLTLLAGDFVVFCNGATRPAWCDFSYGATISLGNGGDKLTLKDGFGTLIDEVTGFLAGWPSSVSGTGIAGVALALDPGRETAAKNDLTWSWCAAQGTMTCGDIGSPGEQNAACAGGLVIPADPAKSTVRATTNVAADGHSHAIVSVELKASDDTPAAGRSVTFSEGHASAAVVDPTGGNGTVITDANGRSAAYVTDTEVESITITITDDSPAPKITLPAQTVTFVAPTSGTTAAVNGANLSVSGGTFSQAAAYDPASMPAGLAADVVLPYGVIATTITVAPGGQAVLSVTLPSRIVQSYRLYKFGSEAGHLAPHWYDVSKHARVAGFKDPNTTYTLTLTDGGFGDADGLANGVIVDPQAIVQDPSAIPTLGEWAVILLALGMVALAVRRLRIVRQDV